MNSFTRALPHRALSVILAGVLLALAAVVAPVAAPRAAAAKWCYESACPGYDAWASSRGQSHWGQYSGPNCTNYVAWRLQSAGIARWLWPSASAGGWAEVAQNNGLTVDNNPTVGAIAWWAYNGSRGSAGHVAIVEAVNGSTITVSQDSYSTGPYSWEDLSATGAGKPDGYIHVPGFSSQALGGKRGVNGLTWSGTDIPLSGDWNGDGVDEIGVYRTNYFYQPLGGSGTASQVVGFGNGIANGDIPITGDWDGDGDTDTGVARGNTFLLAVDGVEIRAISFGNGIANGDIPITGDWDGDGITDVGVNRGNEFRQTITGLSEYRRITFGNGYSNGDIPLTGDWNSDGITDVGVNRGNGFLLTLGNGVAWRTITFGNSVAGGDAPIVGDWNGDGAADVGLVRNNLFILAAASSGGSATAYLNWSFGNGGSAAF